MRKLIGFIVTLAVFTACKTANTSEQVDETTQKADFGTLEIHKAFKSEFFHSRDINVWLPSVHARRTNAFRQKHLMEPSKLERRQRGNGSTKRQPHPPFHRSGNRQSPRRPPFRLYATQSTRLHSRR